MIGKGTGIRTGPMGTDHYCDPQMHQQKESKAKYFSTKALAKATAVIFFSALVISTVSAVQTQNDLDVNVTVAQDTIIDIQPKEFSWGGGNLFPGDVAGPTEEQVGQYGRIQIENLGSVNITEVWFNTTAPSTRPFGTGDKSKYDTGNFISIDRTGQNDPNSFVGRTEFGLEKSGAVNTQDIIYLETKNNWDYGRFRNTSYEYFWTVNDTTTDLSTDGVFRIGVDHHNETQTGSTDLSSPCQGGDEADASGPNCNGYNLNTVTADGTTWAYTGVEVGALDTSQPASDGGELYCAVMNQSQVLKNDEAPEVEFIKWNKEHPAVKNVGTNTDCYYATNYTVGSDSPTDKIVPGDWITMGIRAKIPYGVVSGEVPTGNLVAIARSNQ